MKGLDMTNLKRPALLVDSNGHRTYESSIPIRELERLLTVDRYNPDLANDDPNQGYQREPEPRYRQFGQYLVDTHGQFPVMPFVLSSRDTKMRFREDGVEGVGEISFSPNNPLFIVDGQHRNEGAKYALNELGAEFLADRNWPVVIIEGLTKVEEMELFVGINAHSKGVRTDLVNTILAQRAHSEGDEVIPDKDLWKVVVTWAIHKMNESAPWKGRITLPNEHAPTKKEIQENPKIADERLVRATSVMTSLKSVYEYAKIAGQMEGTAEEQGNRLAEYVLGFWKAIAHINPELFKNPSEFVIQKTPGLFSLHGLLLHLMRVMYPARREWTQAEFALHLKDAKNGIFSTEFWVKDPTGTAQKYGGMKGFGQLTDLLVKSLR